MSWVRRVLRMVLVSAIGVYLLLLLLAAFSDHMIFQPHPASYRMETLALGAGGPVETYRIATAHGAIAAAYLPNPAARYTLLYSHGNGEDLGDDIAFLAEFRRAGFAVFAYEYNGYGLSEGKPSEAALHADAEAAFDYLTGTTYESGTRPVGRFGSQRGLHVPPEQVIAFGHSLGAAQAIYLATKRPVAGVIALAPFLSVFRVITQVPIVPWDKFNNAANIQRVHCPVLVAQGRRDEVIPFWHGQRIYKLANPPKQALWLDHAHHNDVMLVASEEFMRGIREFAAKL